MFSGVDAVCTKLKTKIPGHLGMLNCLLETISTLHLMQAIRTLFGVQVSLTSKIDKVEHCDLTVFSSQTSNLLYGKTLKIC